MLSLFLTSYLRLRFQPFSLSSTSRFFYIQLSFFLPFFLHVPQVIDKNTGRTKLLARIEDFFASVKVVDANAASSTRVVDSKIDLEVSSWRLAEYKTRYANSLEARRLGVMFAAVPSRLCSTVGTFVVVGISVLGLGDGRFFGDRALAR